MFFNKKRMFTSKILHGLGCLFIGTPTELRVPDDFYYLPGNRSLATPEQRSKPMEVRRRLAANNFRRNVFRWVYASSTVVSTAVCLALFVVLNLVR